MSDIKKTLKSFKTDSELQIFLEARELAFIDISKKLNSLEKENENLKKQVEKINIEKNQERSKQLSELGEQDAEIICKTQIELLRLASDERLLTLEESKKLDTYTKILTQIRQANKNNDKDLKDKSTEELLSVIQGGLSNEE